MDVKEETKEKSQGVCNYCHGTGKVDDDDMILVCGMPMAVFDTKKCRHCNGTGRR